MNNTPNVSQTILQQLGGSRFVAMTGARNFATGGMDLGFNIGRNAAKVTYVKVTLDPNDTYTVQFMNFRGVKVKNIATRGMVYGDGLQQVFEQITGLRTSL